MNAFFFDQKKQKLEITTAVYGIPWNCQQYKVYTLKPIIPADTEL